jgi:hypothetical protein
MSWGGSESPNETAYDSTFTTPAGHQGVTFIAASGDSGSLSGAQWPASSPNVLSVGGTTLSIDSAGNNAGETAWYGSGGGYSLFEPEPAYQMSVQSSGARSTPDVAFDADPNTGVSVYFTAPSTGRSTWEVVGGTSVGAPSWAGIMAIVDQGLATAGKGSLAGATQTLPALYKLPASDFHTVTSTASSSGFGGFYLLAFGPGGWYLVGFPGSGSQTSTVTETGLGTPNGSSLVNDLVHGTSSSTSAGSTGTGTGATTGGTTGTGPTGTGTGQAGTGAGQTGTGTGTGTSGGQTGTGGTGGGQTGGTGAGGGQTGNPGSHHHRRRGHHSAVATVRSAPGRHAAVTTHASARGAAAVTNGLPTSGSSNGNSDSATTVNASASTTNVSTTTSALTFIAPNDAANLTTPAPLQNTPNPHGVLDQALREIEAELLAI